MKKFRLLKQSLAFLLSLSMTLGPCAPGLTAARAETISSDYGAGTEDQEAGNSAVDEAAQAYDNDAVGRDSSETEAAEEDNASEQAENVQAASTEQSEAASEGITFEENQAVDAGEASGLESEADSETVTSENGEIEAASETAAEESAESQAGAEAFSEENEEPTTGATVESAASSNESAVSADTAAEAGPGSDHTAEAGPALETVADDSAEGAAESEAAAEEPAEEGADSADETSQESATGKETLPAAEAETASVSEEGTQPTVDDNSLRETQTEAETSSAWLVLSGEAEEAKISVVFPRGAFPEGAVLEVRKVDEDSPEQEEILRKIHGETGSKGDRDEEEGQPQAAPVTMAAAYELIVLDADGEEMEADPDKGDIYVLFEGVQCPEPDCSIYRMDGLNGDRPEELKTLKSGEAGYEEFLSAFSSAAQAELDSEVDGTLIPAEGKVLNDLSDRSGSEAEDNTRDTIHEAVRTDRLGFFVLAWNKEQGLLDGSILLSNDQTPTSGSCGTGAFWAISGEGNDETLTITGSGTVTEPVDGWVTVDDIRTLVIEPGITVIGDSAFAHLFAVAKAEIPDTVTKIGSRAFEGCNSLQEIVIPEGVTEIGDTAFFECYALAQVSLPETLKTIGAYAFSSCENLESIVIPNSVTTIGDRAFGYLDAVPSETRIRISGVPGSAAQTYAEENDLPFVSVNAEDGDLFWGINADGELKISKAALPDGYTGGTFSGDMVFTEYKNAPWYVNRSSITSVTVDDEGGVVEPSSTAFWFYNLNNVVSMDLTGLDTSNATTVASMFRNCNALTDLELSTIYTERAKDMSYMFLNCRSLEQLDVRSFITIEVRNMAGMFGGCRELESLDVRSFSTENVTSMNGMFMACESLAELDLSSFSLGNVTDMNQMFDGCTVLKAMDLSGKSSNGLVYGDYMFRNCAALEELSLFGLGSGSYSKSVNWLSGCSMLRKLEISSYIDVEIPLPHTMYDIYGDAYSTVPGGSFGLTLYTKEEDDTSWQDDYNYNLDTSNGIIYIYSYKGSETNITLPAEAQLFGVQYRTMLSSNSIWDNVKDSLESITFEPGITASDDALNGLFSGYSRLKTADLSGMRDIGSFSETFLNCMQLTEVRMKELESHNLLENLLESNGMFRNCIRLKSVEIEFPHCDFSSSEGMFANCRMLEQIDLSSMCLGPDSSCSDMFQGCSALSSVKTPDVAYSMGVAVEPEEPYFLLNAELPNSMYGPDGTVFSQLPAACRIQSFRLTTTPVFASGVDLDIHEAELIIPGNENIQLSAQVSPANTTFPGILWESSDYYVAEVDSNGFVTARGSGSTIITASTEDGKYKDTCRVTVTVPVTGITLSETVITRPFEDLYIHNSPSVALSAYLQPEGASNRDVIWSSSDPTVIFVEETGWDYSSSVYLYALRPGTVTVTAKTEDGGYSASCTVTAEGIPVSGIELDQVSQELRPGDYLYLTAHVEPDNASNQRITWESSDTNVVTVDGSGQISAVRPGTAEITATTEEGGYTSSCEVRVRIPVTGVQLDQSDYTAAEGETIILTAEVEPYDASNLNVIWSSSDESVATVDENGNVTANSPGTAVITVTTEDGGHTASCEVTVQRRVTGIRLDQSHYDAVQGDTFSLTAYVEPEDASNRNIRWKSSDESVATVDENGNVTVISPGGANIFAITEDGGFSAYCGVWVEPAWVAVREVRLDEYSLTVTEGESFTLHAFVEPSDASEPSVVWSSSAESIATVDEYGNVETHMPGNVTITVTTAEGGCTAECNITVEASVPSWKKLQKEIEESPEGTIIVLEADYTAEPDDVSLKVNKRITINLNGHTLDRGLSGQEGRHDGSVIRVYSNGNLIITDGSTDGTGLITGGSSDLGGGVNIDSAVCTMMGGNIRGNTAVNAGGGVCVSGDGRFDLQGGTITENSSGNNGGGVSQRDNSEFHMSGGTISSNIASGQGGGVFVSGTMDLVGGEVTGNKSGSYGGGVNVAGSLKMYGGKVYSNEAEKNSGGICLSNSAGSLVIRGGEIRNNTAGESGGGISVFGDAEIRNAVISQNHALQRGGGILGGAAAAKKLLLENSEITGNTADEDGGGVYAGLSPVEINSSNVSSNKTGRNGGGIIASDITIKDSSVNNNEAAGQCGGIATSGVLDMENTAVEGNTAASAVGGIDVRNGASVTMRSGSVRKNQAVSGASGGVRIINGGSFVMESGGIEENSAGTNGGGVSVNGTFTMKGGSITGNTSGSSGGGVILNTGGVFGIQGAPIIRNNKLVKNGTGTANNVYLTTNSKLSGSPQNTITVQGTLQGAEIGITTAKTPGGSASEVIFTNGLKGKGDASAFRSDAGYDVTLSSGGEAALSKMDPKETFIRRLYRTCLGREADEDGLAYWLGLLNSGAVKGTGLAAKFVFSNEFTTKNYCNEHFVRQIYPALMGREPDDGGVNYWAGRLESGTQREKLINEFTASNEYARLCAEAGIELGPQIKVPEYGTQPYGACAVCGDKTKVVQFVERTYKECMGREADEGGLKYWSQGLYEHTKTGKSLVVSFALSSEMKNKGLSNEAYISAIYRVMLGREADAGGLAYWKGRMQKGGSISDVINGFVDSNEFTGICNDYGIQRK